MGMVPVREVNWRLLCFPHQIEPSEPSSSHLWKIRSIHLQSSDSSSDKEADDIFGFWCGFTTFVYASIVFLFSHVCCRSSIRSYDGLLKSFVWFICCSTIYWRILSEIHNNHARTKIQWKLFCKSHLNLETSSTSLSLEEPKDRRRIEA